MPARLEFFSSLLPLRLGVLAIVGACLLAGAPSRGESAEARLIRVATFNSSLSRNEAGQLRRELLSGKSEQARLVADVLRRVRADVILLNEFDFDKTGKSAAAFQRLYLESKSRATAPLTYAYRFTAPVNTGEPSGMDLNADGVATGPEDAFGFGKHPGQYGMLVLSRFPLEAKSVRTFQKFLWRDMPQALRPQLNGRDYYSNATFNRLRLSSKSFWDVPITIEGQTLHLLASHPTPPVFDGPEDRNGARNHDELRLLADYVAPGRGGYLYDDRGRRGGLEASGRVARPRFVIVGDLNADPWDGDSRDRPAKMLLDTPTIQGDQPPTSRGAASAGRRAGGVNGGHRGPPDADTASFSPRGAGNLRIDYVLPSRNLPVYRAGVYWPPEESPQARLLKASDHRAVWVDLIWDAE